MAPFGSMLIERLQEEAIGLGDVVLVVGHRCQVALKLQ